MDTERVDALTRRLVAGPSRRGLLRTMFGSAMALAGIASVGSPVAVAGKRKRKNKKRCKGGKKQCGKQCFELQTDPLNCGGCARRCAAGEVCQISTCQPQPQALGCTADDTICRDDVGSNIHNCNGDTEFCGSLNDGSPVCMSEAACVACTSARDCITHFQSLVGPEEAQRALCIDSCPHCKQVFGVNTVCIIPAIPLTP